MTIHIEAYHFCKLSICRPACCAMNASNIESLDAVFEYSNVNEGSHSEGIGKTYMALAGKNPAMVDIWDRISVCRMDIDSIRKMLSA